MMYVTAQAMNHAYGRIPHVEVQHLTSLGSGLARLDVFDWMARIRELETTFQPDVTVAWFGANDRQPMQVDDRLLQPGDPAWDAEYSRRVATAMETLTARKGARVYWLELPDMRNARLHEDVNHINGLLRVLTETRDQAFFVATRPILSRTPGQFSPYVVGPRGLPLHVRDPDGVHLNRAGADLLTQHLRKILLDER